MALRASIFHIELAMDGKVDFLKRTNPWGGGDEDSDHAGKVGEPPVTGDGDLDRQAVQRQLEQALRVFG